MKKIKILPLISLYLLYFYLTIFAFLTIEDFTGELKTPTPMGIDYALFYTTGKMVQNGEINNIYKVSNHHDALEKLLHRKIPFLVQWFYPPTFLIPIVLLGYLPYYLSLIIWILTTLCFAIYAVSKLVPDKKAALLLADFLVSL